MDLTSLNEDDTEAVIEGLCRRADTPHGHPAAVCVYPQFVATACRSLAALGLGRKVEVATVANFPRGDAPTAEVVEQIEHALNDGADEIDVVFPWRALLEGDENAGTKLVQACREACGEHSLKVILETGQLDEADRIRRAGELAIDAGADFLKTSTGKVAVNATPRAARILLETIRDSGRDVGCKVAGGIGTTEDASTYLELAADIMGDDWLTPAHFRIGASGLLDDLLATLGSESSGPTGSENGC